MAKSGSMNEERDILLRKMEMDDCESDEETAKSEMALDDEVLPLGDLVAGNIIE
jgi:hypothetical protein